MFNLTGDILTPTGWLQGSMTISGTQVTQISGTPISEEQVMGRDEPKFIPGFIDLHVHGGAGVDLMSGGDSLAHIARHQIKHGTTSFLATSMTAPLPELERVLTGIKQHLSQTIDKDQAKVLGVHLEGPYINPGRLGAQPAWTRDIVLTEILHLNDITPIRVLTLAPECVGDRHLIEHLTQMGIRVQIGHSHGSYEDGVNALKHGASGFTHLFNAMTPLHHREPGMVGAALAHAHYAELIPDLLHVHPGAIHVALRAIPHVYCVTDGTAATGMPDGMYMLGSQEVNKCLGGVRLKDGTLAGSTLTMIDALRNLHSIGLSIAEASQRLSTVPAQYLGLNNRGQLVEQAIAYIVVIDKNLHLHTVYTRGEAHA